MHLQELIGVAPNGEDYEDDIPFTEEKYAKAKSTKDKNSEPDNIPALANMKCHFDTQNMLHGLNNKLEQWSIFNLILVSITEASNWRV